MKKAIVIMLFFICSGPAWAKTEESQLIEQMKKQACGKDQACQSLFTSALGMTAMISRYHGECLGDNDLSKQCKNAENTYKEIQSEYERDKAARN